MKISIVRLIQLPKDRLQALLLPHCKAGPPNNVDGGDVCAALAGTLADQNIQLCQSMLDQLRGRGHAFSQATSCGPYYVTVYAWRLCVEYHFQALFPLCGDSSGWQCHNGCIWPFIEKCGEQLKPLVLCLCLVRRFRDISTSLRTVCRILG